MDWLWITGNLCRLLLNQLSVTPVKMTASGQWYSPIQVKDILSVGVQAPVLRVTTPERKGFENFNCKYLQAFQKYELLFVLSF